MDSKSIVVAIKQKINSQDLDICLFPVKDIHQNENQVKIAKKFLKENEYYKVPKEFSNF
jgi:hypothetical protein